MTEACIFYAIHTPRVSGKATAALHQVKAINLLSTLLNTVRQRNKLGTDHLDGPVIAVSDLRY